MNCKTKKRKPVETVRDFRDRIATMLNGGVPPVKKVNPLFVRGKGQVLSASKK